MFIPCRNTPNQFSETHPGSKSIARASDTAQTMCLIDTVHTYAHCFSSTPCPLSVTLSHFLTRMSVFLASSRLGKGPSRRRSLRAVTAQTRTMFHASCRPPIPLQSLPVTRTATSSHSHSQSPREAGSRKDPVWLTGRGADGHIPNRSCVRTKLRGNCADILYRSNEIALL